MAITVSEAAAVLGRLGGQSKSPAKVKAVRENGKRGGRPKVTNRQIERFAEKTVSAWRELSK